MNKPSGIAKVVLKPRYALQYNTSKQLQSRIGSGCYGTQPLWSTLISIYCLRGGGLPGAGTSVTPSHNHAGCVITTSWAFSFSFSLYSAKLQNLICSLMWIYGCSLLPRRWRQAHVIYPAWWPVFCNWPIHGHRLDVACYIRCRKHVLHSRRLLAEMPWCATACTPPVQKLMSQACTHESRPCCYSKAWELVKEPRLALFLVIRLWLSYSVTFFFYLLVAWELWNQWCRYRCLCHL